MTATGTMKKLLKKEIRLTIYPASYLFALLGALLLIPQYPYVVSIIYTVFSVFLTFNLARENNDHEFTAMLPVPRKQIVATKHMTVLYLELVQLLVAIPCALVSSLVLWKDGNLVGMDANFAFFGLALIYYAVFNYIFLTRYFKTGYKTGIPILLATGAFALTVVVCETLIAFVPALKAALDSLDPSTFVFQIPLLVVGIAILIGSTWLSYKKSVRNFEKVSL